MKEINLLLPVVAGLPPLTGEQVVEIIRQIPAIVAAVTALVVAVSARHHARRAREQAADAAEQAKEAAREQINFALRAAARREDLARRGAAAVNAAGRQAESGAGTGEEEGK
jgi:hypothetical protein